MKKMLLSLSVLILSATVLQAQNLWEIISTSPDHETLTIALQQADLDVVLNTDEAVDFTIWAPTDAAFDALPDGVLPALLANDELLLDVLTYHVGVETLLAADLADGQSWTTLLGPDVEISIDGSDISVNESTVVSPFDLEGEFGGVVHSIDAVLQPPSNICVDFEAQYTTLLPDAPVQVDGVCSTVSTNGAVWASELYVTEGFVEGTEYVVSICDGPGAGTWTPQISVFNSEGALVATVSDDCTLNFIAPADGTYLIGISEEGACGDSSENLETDNGVLSITCVGETVDNSIFEIVSNSEDHLTLTAALEASGLDVPLSGPGQFTLFAPTDAAFAVLGDAVDDLLLDPTGALANVLLYHLLDEVALSTDLSDGLEIQTAQGELITVTFNGDDIFINGAQVTMPDLEAGNGVVHVIDAVLMPTLCTQFIQTAFTFQDAGGAPAPDVNGNCQAITVTEFGAYASEAYLIPGMVEGTSYEFSICDGPGAGAWEPVLIVQNAVTGEIYASAEDCEITWTASSDDNVNVIVQEIGFCGSQSGNIEEDNGGPSLNCIGSPISTVVDVITNSPEHTTLANLIDLANLEETLAGEGPFTVFAPTNEAFDAVDQETIDDLTSDPSGLLTQVLTYHVAAGAVFSGDLSDGQEIPTVNGEIVTIGIDGEVVTVGNSSSIAAVIQPDIEATNGVVHVIDAVLLPLTLSVDHIAALNSLNIFPNPANQQFTVDINLAQSSRVMIDMVNVVGQTVRSYDLNTRSSGLNRHYIDVSALPAGFYLINITVGESQVVSKVQVMK